MNFKNMLSTAFRSLMVKGQHTPLKILCLTAGLGFSVVLVAEIIQLQSYDTFFRDSDRIYEVRETTIMNGEYKAYQATPGAWGPALEKNIPQIETATRMTGIGDLAFKTEDNREFRSSSVMLCDTSLFKIFDRKILVGDASQILASSGQCMVSKSLYDVLGEDIIGQRVIFAEYPYFKITVEGVYQDFPENSTMGKTDVIWSLEDIGKAAWDGRDNWVGNDRYRTFVRIAPGVDPDSLEEPMRQLLENNVDMDEVRQSGVDLGMTLTSVVKSHRKESEVKTKFVIMLSLAALLTLVALMNWLLISIGGIAYRAKEFAVRKCYGAGNGYIVGLTFTEALIQLLISSVLAGLLIFACKGTIEQLLSVSLGNLFTGAGILAPIIIAVIALAVGGWFPGRMYASVPVSSAFRGYKERNRRWKSVSLAVQFAGCTLLLSLLAVVSLQYRMMTSTPTGYNTEQTAVLTINADLKNAARLNGICKNALESMPEVESVSSSITLLTDEQSGNNVQLPGEGVKQYFNLSDLYWCGPDYFETMDIEILDGEGFIERADTTVLQVMVSKSFEDRMKELAGWDRAVGKRVIITEHSYNDRVFTICGVFNDLLVGSIANRDERPQVLFFDSMYMGNLIVKLKDMSYENMEKVKAVIAENVEQNSFSFRSYSSLIEENYREERNFRSEITLIGIIILLITLTGLVGYVSDEIERRRKEVAIRKINGATAQDILWLFSRSIGFLALISGIAGAVLGWFVSFYWLRTFSAKISLSPLLFIGVIIIVLAIVAAVTASTAMKIANSNPSEFLKDE